MGNSRLRRTSGFTLVELLVVIGVIAVLMSLLLPAFRRAREAAIRTKCLAHIREMGVYITMYANDNRDVVRCGLFGAGYTPTLGWNVVDNWNDAFKSSQLYTSLQNPNFRCPKNGAGPVPYAMVMPDATDIGVMIHYPYGDNWAPFSWKYTFLKRTRVSHVSDYLISIDSAKVNAPGSGPLYVEYPPASPSIKMVGNAASAGGQLALPWIAHNKRANALFLDGHAESCDFERLKTVKNKNSSVTRGFGLSQRWDSDRQVRIN